MTRVCAICPAKLTPHDGETARQFDRRRTCGPACGGQLSGAVRELAAILEESGAVAAAMAGHRFDALALRPAGTWRGSAETWVPRGSATSWASEG